MIGLYEIGYSRGKPRQLDESFQRYDSSDVNNPPYREIPAFYKFASSNLWRGEGYFGLFSPRFTIKTGVTGTEVERFIHQTPGYDIYLFHPYPREILIANEFLSLAELEHAGISDALNNVWINIFGRPRPLVHLKNDFALCCHCNYFVANQRFWNGYSKFVKRFYAYLFSEEGSVLRSYTEYTLDTSGDTHLPLGVFAFERCLTLYLSMKREEISSVNYAFANQAWSPVDSFYDEEQYCSTLMKRVRAAIESGTYSARAYDLAIAAYYNYRKLTVHGGMS